MALRLLLTQCGLANEAGAMETLLLHPELISEQWVGEEFSVGEGESRKLVLRGCTAIMAASGGGSEVVVRELIKRGSYVNVRVEGGPSALICAADNGHAGVVSVLLENGADPNVLCPLAGEQVNALAVAADWDFFPICLILLGRGADLFALDAVNPRGGVLEDYGRWAALPLAAAIKEERRAALRAAFAEGPHSSQVQRRRDERWARRWPFMMIMVGHDFQPLAARSAILLAANPPLPPHVRIPPLPNRTRAQRRALLNMRVFGHTGIWRIIASFL